MFTDKIIELLPFLIPIILIDWALAITAIVHIVKHPNYKCGNKVMWILISLFIQIVGPILYFVIGKCDEE